MNFSDETVEKAALKIFDTYSASGIAADWAKDLNWHDVKRMAKDSEAYAKVRDLCYREAKAALSSIPLADLMQVEEVRAILMDIHTEALKGLERPYLGGRYSSIMRKCDKALFLLMEPKQ